MLENIRRKSNRVSSTKNPKQSDIDKGQSVMSNSMSTHNLVVVEMANRRAFVDFVEGLLNLDPIKRWSPQQATKHPFITGEKFNGKFEVSSSAQSKRNILSYYSHHPYLQRNSRTLLLRLKWLHLPIQARSTADWFRHLQHPAINAFTRMPLPTINSLLNTKHILLRFKALIVLPVTHPFLPVTTSNKLLSHNNSEFRLINTTHLAAKVKVNGKTWVRRTICSKECLLKVTHHQDLYRQFGILITCP